MELKFDATKFDFEKFKNDTGWDFAKDRENWLQKLEELDPSMHQISCMQYKGMIDDPTGDYFQFFWGKNPRTGKMGPPQPSMYMEYDDIIRKYQEQNLLGEIMKFIKFPPQVKQCIKIGRAHV